MPGTLDTTHKRRHRDQEEWLKQLVGQLRLKIPLEPYWSINVIVCCPEEMPASEGQLWYDHEAWYAEINIRCDLPPRLQRWVVYHETIELFLWKTGLIYSDLLKYLPDEIRNTIMQGIFLARNQEVEQLIRLITGENRPARLLRDGISAVRGQKSARSRETEEILGEIEMQTGGPISPIERKTEDIVPLVPLVRRKSQNKAS